MAPSDPFGLSGALIALAAAGFWAYCLFDLARTDDWGVRTFSKPVWCRPGILSWHTPT